VMCLASGSHQNKTTFQKDCEKSIFRGRLNVLIGDPPDPGSCPRRSISRLSREQRGEIIEPHLGLVS
jgi:hypothetical protein